MGLRTFSGTVSTPGGQFLFTIYLQLLMNINFISDLCGSHSDCALKPIPSVHVN